MRVAQWNLINLAESSRSRTERLHQRQRTHSPGTVNNKCHAIFFFAHRHRASNRCCPLLNFLRLLRGRLIGRTPDFESGYRGSSPRPGANLLLQLKQRRSVVRALAVPRVL